MKLLLFLLILLALPIYLIFFDVDEVQEKGDTFIKCLSISHDASTCQTG